MVKVYVWKFRGKREAWGHASMEVGRDYISWWPEAAGRSQSKISDDLFSAHPIMGRRLEDDIRDEGGSPDRTIIIAGLDEARIRAWWHRIAPWAAGRQGPPSLAWSTLRWNCSKVVASALKEGGGDRHASWWKSWNVVWTPNDVCEYAESIVRGMV
jgi:hypothetical protein